LQNEASSATIAGVLRVASVVGVAGEAVRGNAALLVEQMDAHAHLPCVTPTRDGTIGALCGGDERIAQFYFDVVNVVGISEVDLAVGVPAVVVRQILRCTLVVRVFSPAGCRQARQCNSGNGNPSCKPASPAGAEENLLHAHANMQGFDI